MLSKPEATDPAGIGARVLLFGPKLSAMALVTLFVGGMSEVTQMLQMS